MAAKRVIHTTKAAAAIGPYSQAVLIQGTLYISGQLGIDPATSSLKDGVEQQASQALDNMGHILQTAGMSFDHVVKTTVLLADMADFAKVNAIYSKYFTKNYPARAAYQVAALPKGGLVEIEAIAMSDNANDSSSKSTRPSLHQQGSIMQHTV